MTDAYFQEPKRYWWTVRTRRLPRYLFEAQHGCMFGWWLEHLGWERQPDGTVLTETCWQRREPYVCAMVPGRSPPVRAYRLYPSVSWCNRLRIAWLWLWNTPGRAARQG